MFLERLYFSLKVFCFLFVITFPLGHLKAMIAGHLETDGDTIHRLLSKKITQESSDSQKAITFASLSMLEHLRTSDEHGARTIPGSIVKQFGRAFGNIAYGASSSLTPYEELLLPFLEAKTLSYEDLRTWGHTFKFGPSPHRSVVKQLSGKELAVSYHFNFPLYFNRLLAAFKGNGLLIGGGEKCDCGKGSIQHPKELFYHVDIDNASLPDLVIHAGYLQHLHYFPPERFDFVWFEHCTVSELLTDKQVLEQYFRITKPGALFVLQSNFFLEDKYAQRIVIEHFNTFVNTLKAYKFIVLENVIKKELRHGESMSYQQLIFMKPYKINPSVRASATEDPRIVHIPFASYQEATKDERAVALLKAKLCTDQIKLELCCPLDQLLYKKEE